MAVIKLMGPESEAVLGEPDEDGDYRWTCLDCGERGDVWRPLDEALADAEIHVDLKCPLLTA
jgi:hypothetical protein